MAARRLLIVMLVLLGLSTLAAALVPQRTTEESTTTTTAEDAQLVPADKVPKGSLVQFAVAIDPERISVVPVSAGDQLQLAICSSKSADGVEIPAFGELEQVAPDKPALFDLFLDAQGTYGVSLVEGDRLVARIQVGPPQPETDAESSSSSQSGPQKRCARTVGFL